MDKKFCKLMLFVFTLGAVFCLGASIIIRNNHPGRATDLLILSALWVVGGFPYYHRLRNL